MCCSLTGRLSLLYIFLQKLALINFSCSSLRIVDGNLAEISDYPYAASVQFNNTHICGASIIGLKYILTAASCIERYKTGDLKIRVGSSFYKSGGQLLNVGQIHMHPTYNQPTPLLNNLAILELSPQLHLDQNVTIISTAANRNLVLDQGTIVGWGVVDRQSGLVRPYKPSEQLRYVTQPIIGQWTCEKNFLEGWDGDTMFCAGTSLKDNCVGDLGNPFVINNILTGMVSRIHTMCGRIPTAYANVTSQLDFIYGILNS